jgi:gag-polypeptide of LTR copia-type/GAG-pre-integrase domain
MILAWLFNCLSPSILAQVVNCSTSSQLWKHLTQLYNSQSLAKILEFKLKLQMIKKGNDTCAQYLQKIQSIVDRLDNIGAPVSDQDFFLYTSQVLGSEFESFVIAFSLRQGSLSSIELYTLLLAHEPHIQANLQHVNLTSHNVSSSSGISSSQPYLRGDKVHMGNGSGLFISHTGTTSITHSFGTLHLGNILCVPHLTKNLLSIAQLLKDNPVSVEFTSNSCFVKDLTTQRVLLCGSLCNGLYALDLPYSQHVQVYHTTHSSSDIWHTRLAHCSPQLLKLLHRNNKITMSSSTLSSCTDYIRAKSHKLLFSNSFTVAKHLLHVVHTDVWGPSPVLSHLGNHYYVLFTNQFSRFSWVYFCSAKSDI